jgi:hypothetical protein
MTKKVKTIKCSAKKVIDQVLSELVCLEPTVIIKQRDESTTQ